MIFRLSLIYFFYLLGPNDSINYLAVLFIFLIINHLKFKVKNANLLRADFLFIISLFLIHFLIPFLIDTYDFNYRYDNKNQLVILSKYSFLSVLAFSFSYSITKNNNSKVNLIDNRTLDIYLSLIDKFLFISILTFYVSAGSSYITAEIYNNSNSTNTLFGVAAYIFTIIIILLLLRFSATAINPKLLTSKKTTLFKLMVIIFLLTLFFAGDRSSIIIILIAIFTLIQLSKFKLNKLKITLLSISTLFLLSITRIYRAETLVYNGFTDSIIASFLNIADSFRVYYYSYSIVELDSYLYGISMLGPIAGCIPFLQGFLVKSGILFENSLNSSNIFTIFRHDSLNITGEGSTMLADLYLNFGLIGCLIGMIIFGYIYKKITTTNFQSQSILPKYYAFVFICFSIYLARATFFYPLKFLVWGYFLHKFFLFLAYRFKS